VKREQNFDQHRLIAALAPDLLNGTYGGTKAYVVNLTQSLHHEVGDKGIQVQAVLSGATSTEFWDRAGLAVHHLPEEIVMTAEEKFNAARLALAPNLSHKHPAAGYGAGGI
jgi:short-subunit dehydrogenase